MRSPRRGLAVSEIQDRLVAVLAAYGVESARVVVLPTSVLISLGPARAATIERTPQIGASLRLDQISAVYELVEDAERGAVPLDEGLERLREVRDLPPRFGALVRVFGNVVLATGICLILEPEPRDLAAAASLGGLVAVLGLGARGRRRLEILLPVIAAVVVSALTFLAAEHGLIDGTLRPLISALITFLPGAALATATVELASGEMIAGASRLVYGALQLLLLAFGIAAGAVMSGVATSTALIDSETSELGSWAPWLGVLVFGIGTMLYFCAPRHSLHWLLVALYVAWVGQVLGDLILLGETVVGGALSGFFGALAMTPAAYLIASRPTGPPATVTFLPAFWLLVPGALGLIGVTEFVGQSGQAGLDDFVAAVGSIIAIALGVLVGTWLYESAGTLKRLANGSGDDA